MEHGKLIKKMRKERKISRADLTKNAGSSSALRNFENNCGRIDFDTLWTYLKRMNVRMDEYCLMYSKYTLEKKDNFRIKFKESLENYNAPIYLDSLKKEFKNSNDIFYEYLIIQSKVISQKFPNDYLPKTTITKEDVRLLHDYLENVDNWGYFELAMYTNCLAVFKHNYLAFNYLDVLAQFEKYRTSFKYRLCLNNFLINSLILAFEEKNLHVIPELLNKLKEKTQDSEYILGRVYYKFFSSLYQSIQGTFPLDISIYETILLSLDYVNDAKNMKDIKDTILSKYGLEYNKF